MTSKVPLTLDTSTNTIEELPSGDDLNLSGCNISSVGNITAGNSITANYFVGTLYGNANNATTAGSANTAGTVTTNAQPNITSVGTLTSLTVSGNSNLGSVANVKITGGSNNQVIKTDGSGNLSFTTVSGDSYMLAPVRVATVDNITLSGTQTIDSVAVIAGDRVLVRRQTTQTQNGIYVVASGGWTRATDFDTGAATLQGGVTVTARAGTELGGVTFVCTNTTAITVGSTNITWGRVVGDAGLISIWTSSNPFDNRANASANSGAVAIGVAARASTDGTSMGYSANASSQSVAIGYAASAPASGTSIGISAGTQSAVTGSISVGRTAGAGANNYTVAVGMESQGTGAAVAGANAIAVGYRAGWQSQGAQSIAIGTLAGNASGANSIAIGYFAGRQAQHANSIILNATGANLNSDGASRFYVAPVRAANTEQLVMYNTTTNEVSYGNTIANAASISATGNISGNNIRATTFVVCANATVANLTSNTPVIVGVAGAAITVSDQDYQLATWSTVDNVWKYVSNRANV